MYRLCGSLRSVRSGLQAECPFVTGNALTLPRYWCPTRDTPAWLRRKGSDISGIDPNYAAAYTGLADAYILAGSYGNSFYSGHGYAKSEASRV
jgi:hypothetical protein